jgi:hypothetical protein
MLIFNYDKVTKDYNTKKILFWCSAAQFALRCVTIVRNHFFFISWSIPDRWEINCCIRSVSRAGFREWVSDGGPLMKPGRPELPDL